MNSIEYNEEKIIDESISNKREFEEKSKSKTEEKKNKQKNEIEKVINFKISEIVLGKIKGYSFWPGKVRFVYLFFILLVSY